MKKKRSFSLGEMKRRVKETHRSQRYHRGEPSKRRIKLKSLFSIEKGRLGVDQK
jgi:hypothetical protein